MGKKKKEEDELVEFIGEVISTESALLACAITIMRAGNIAKDNQDSEATLKVAKAWYDLAKLLGGEEEEKSNPIGFTSELEVLDEPGIDPDESEGGIEIRTKLR